MNAAQLLAHYVGLKHRRGYQHLRLSLSIWGNSVNFLIGPRRYFSSRDGGYVMPQCRKNCLRGQFSDGEYELPATDHEFATLTNAKNTNPNIWDESRGTDIEYADWLDDLTKHLDANPSTRPYRADIESERSEIASLLMIESGKWLEKTAKELFKAPPQGQYPSPLRSPITDPHIITAQPRDINSPELLWGNFRYEDGGKRLDDWYENK